MYVAGAKVPLKCKRALINWTRETPNKCLSILLIHVLGTIGKTLESSINNRLMVEPKDRDVLSLFDRDCIWPGLPKSPLVKCITISKAAKKTMLKNYFCLYGLTYAMLLGRASCQPRHRLKCYYLQRRRKYYPYLQKLTTFFLWFYVFFFSGLNFFSLTEHILKIAFI